MMRAVPADPTRTVAAELAAFAAAHAELPAVVREKAALHMADAVGCGLAAVGIGAGAAATVVAEQQGGSGASLLGSAAGAAPAAAALANGTRCHALDFDDTHERGICHSSAVVAPACLALGEALSTPGTEVLDAFALGSEVALRIAVAAAEGLYARGFHPTSVCGVFGAAAGAARLLGLDAATTTQALGIAGSFASGLFEYLSDGSATKPLHAGWAAQAGIQAASLAAAGATGPATVIEGRFGLLASHAGAGVDSAPITTELGSRWELLELSLKPFPACHFAHAGTWAAAQLVDRHGIDIAEIEEIVVGVPAEGMALVVEPAERKAAPATPYEAKFSLPFCVAHRLVRGRLDAASFSPAALADGEVVALAQRVRGEHLPDPPSRFAGSAAVRTASGTVDCVVEHTPGSPGNPLDDGWAWSKFDANARLALDPAEAAELAAALRDLRRLGSLARVGELLAAARPA